MGGIPVIIAFFYGLIAVAVIVVLCVLIIKRIEAKKKETFEDRDN